MVIFGVIGNFITDLPAVIRPKIVSGSKSATLSSYVQSP